MQATYSLTSDGNIKLHRNHPLRQKPVLALPVPPPRFSTQRREYARRGIKLPPVIPPDFSLRLRGHAYRMAKQIAHAEARRVGDLRTFSANIL